MLYYELTQGQEYCWMNKAHSQQRCPRTFEYVTLWQKGLCRYILSYEPWDGEIVLYYPSGTKHPYKKETGGPDIDIKM